MSADPISADRLREARVYLGLSRDDVSGAMGRERRWGDDIEHGRTTMDSLLARYIPCPACGGQQAGPLHRTSSRLWQGRADRARRYEDVDPVSSVTLEDAERHLAAINKPPDAPYGC